PQPKGQKPGCGFPLLKLVGLFCLQSGALLRTATSNLHKHESVLARMLHKFLDSGDLLLADRGFSSYLDISELAKKGVDCLVRLHQMRSTDFRKGTRLGSNDRLITWTKPARAAHVWSREQFDALPATLTVRMLRFCTQTPWKWGSGFKKLQNNVRYSRFGVIRSTSFSREKMKVTDCASRATTSDDSLRSVGLACAASLRKSRRYTVESVTNCG
ncbi:MAG TPA: transposase, partial [Terrimicrobiaceae bacterium]